MNYDVDAIYAQRAESACKENGFDYQAMKADGYGDRDIYQGVLEQQAPPPVEAKFLNLPRTSQKL